MFTPPFTTRRLSFHAFSLKAKEKKIRIFQKLVSLDAEKLIFPYQKKKLTRYVEVKSVHTAKILGTFVRQI